MATCNIAIEENNVNFLERATEGSSTIIIDKKPIANNRVVVMIEYDNPAELFILGTHYTSHKY